MKTIKFDNKNTDLQITGKVYDIKNNEPLSNVRLSIGCIKIQNSSNGEYSFVIKSNLKDNLLFIEAISIGYKTIQTSLINIVDKNEINIDFYLSEDDRPFINCEGMD